MVLVVCLKSEMVLSIYLQNEFSDFMRKGLVTKLANFISTRALNKQTFLELLNAKNLMYNNSRRLSHKNVLQRLVEYMDQVFLHN